MKVRLLEKIREGCRYVDISGHVWKARYNDAVHEIQLWNADQGYGLWQDGLNIVRRI